MHSVLAIVAYVAVLLAAAVMTFGASLGIVVSLLVACFWRIAFAGQVRIRAIEVVLVVLILGATMVSVAVDSVWRDGRPNSRRGEVCSANLRGFATSLLSKADRTGQLPHAATNGPNGRPFHSWRILTLSNIEQSEIADAYHREEPWDSPHNSELVSTQMRCSNALATTRYSTNDAQQRRAISPLSVLKRLGRRIVACRSMRLLTVAIRQSCSSKPPGWKCRGGNHKISRSTRRLVF
ncbi:MAG: DUF1559 domain-containing protein [Planctomycetaceae bacterium]|nr:DUF1559 domain-containing protein [Planctomycetaceae bacterium]